MGIKFNRTFCRNIFLGASGLGLAYSVYKNDFSVHDIGIVRFSRAALAVAKIITDYKYTLYGVDQNSEKYSELLNGCHRRGSQILLNLAQKNGGVFIKVGQHIASLQYLLPEPYTSTMSVLYSHAPESTIDDINKVFYQSLHKKLADVFDEFEPQSCGAASLAQVHRARLRDTGEIVAVKIQHPKVKARSYVDITTMEFFAKCASFIFPELQLQWLVDETKRNIPQELDFMNEASNADKIRHMFDHLPWLKIPKNYYEYSSDMVLTMEFFDGGQINDLEYFNKNRLDKHDICKKLGRLYSEMIFSKGEIHCDPHFGNILVRRNANGGQEIVLLDHGLYVKLPDELRLNYARLWLAVIKPDMDEVQKISSKLGIDEKYYKLFACILTLRPWKSIVSGITRTKLDEAEGQEIRKFASVLISEISVILDSIPRQIVLILKTNDLLRSISFYLNNQNRLDSFTEMSRHCIHALYTHEAQNTTSLMKKLYLYTAMIFFLLKIRLFEIYLAVTEKIGFEASLGNLI